MAENTKIQWCDHTFNPWEGCTKVSPGCANCYAESRNHRFGLDNWGKGKPRRLTSDANWKQPVRWNDKAERNLKAFFAWADMEDDDDTPPPPRPRVFCASLADWLDDEVPIEWLARLLKLIHDTPNLDWLMLTKRPENWFPRITQAMEKHEPASEMADWLASWRMGNSPTNIWFGFSAEDQTRYDERFAKDIPAAVNFISAEPLLGPIRFEGTLAFDWVIFGGESGRNARPCNIQWIWDGVRQCRDAGVKVFVKQLGAKPYSNFGGWEGHEVPLRLKDPKGGDWSEWPEDLRVREFPL